MRYVNNCFLSVRSLSEDELLLLSPEELCKDRLSEEYFRLKADYDGGDCRDVVRYVQGRVRISSGYHRNVINLNLFIASEECYPSGQ